MHLPTVQHNTYIKSLHKSTLGTLIRLERAYPYVPIVSENHRYTTWQIMEMVFTSFH